MEAALLENLTDYNWIEQTTEMIKHNKYKKPVLPYFISGVFQEKSSLKLYKHKKRLEKNLDYLVGIGAGYDLLFEYVKHCEPEWVKAAHKIISEYYVFLNKEFFPPEGTTIFRGGGYFWSGAAEQLYHNTHREEREHIANVLKQSGGVYS